jgi:hypothetical protein
MDLRARSHGPPQIAQAACRIRSQALALRTIDLRLRCAIHDLRNLVEMRVDVMGQLIEVAPFLAELGRAMRCAI